MKHTCTNRRDEPWVAEEHPRGSATRVSTLPTGLPILAEESSSSLIYSSASIVRFCRSSRTRCRCRRTGFEFTFERLRRDTHLCVSRHSRFPLHVSRSKTASETIQDDRDLRCEAEPARQPRSQGVGRHPDQPRLGKRRHTQGTCAGEQGGSCPCEENRNRVLTLCIWCVPLRTGQSIGQHSPRRIEDGRSPRGLREGGPLRTQL